MSFSLSVRQLLACLDVSVFSDENALALEKLAKERETERHRAFFETVLLAAGMAGCIAATFSACRESAFAPWIGLGLLAAFFQMHNFVSVVWGRCLCWAYMTAGELLLIVSVFPETPLFATVLSGAVFFAANGKTRDVLCRLLSASVFVCTAAAACFPVFGTGALNVAVPFLSFAGFIAYAFPSVKFPPRYAAGVFSGGALCLLAAVQACRTAGYMTEYSFEALPPAFFAEFLFLIWALRRETERREKALFFAAAFTALVCGYCASAGVAGASALFCAAFLADAKADARFAVVAGLVFCVLFVLNLPEDFNAAASECFLIFAVLFALRLAFKARIGRKEGREG